MPPERELARITKVYIEVEDHGLLVFCLDMDCDSGLSQGFTRPMWGAFTEACLRGIMKAVGVHRWDDLVGKDVWVRRQEGLIVEIVAPHFVRDTVAFNVQDVARLFFPPDVVL